MVRVPISRERYLIAGVITILIFSLGLTLGFVIDNYRVKWIEQISKEQEVAYKSLQFQYLFLTELKESEKNCKVLAAALERTIKDLASSLNKFLEYEKDSQLSKDAYQVSARNYLIDNLRYWLLAKKSKEKCGSDIINILYFYSEECPACPDQGVLLTYFKNLLNEKILIFPINTNLKADEPIIDILLLTYNITTYPTLVINDWKYEGLIGKEELESIICAKLKNEKICA